MLWVDRISRNKSIGTSPFHLVYGTYVVFIVHLGLRVMKFLQDQLEETNCLQRRIFQLIEVQQTRELLIEKSQTQKEKVKEIFDKRSKENDSHHGDAIREEKRKHGKFYNLWFWDFEIPEVLDNNAFVLQNLNDEDLLGDPINGRFLKHFFVY